MENRLDMSKIDAEAPRVAEIVALKLAGVGLSIPEDMQKEILSFAERGKEMLKELLSVVGDENVQEYSERENFLRLAAQIAFSRGVDSPEACQLRLDSLRDTVYKDEISQEEVGFTE